MVVLSVRLTRVLDNLAQTCQGLVTADPEAEGFLLRLQDEFVGRVMAETEPRGADEDLQEAAVEVVARHLLAGARLEFVWRMVGVKRNWAGGVPGSISSWKG